MYSILIKNASLFDGDKVEGEILDVAVEGDKIVNIGKNLGSSASEIIDGSGKILTPGFVDIQNHSDAYWQLFDHPQLSANLTQGFTTILVGQCGASLAPLLSDKALLSLQKWHSLEGANINWRTFSEFISEMEKHKFGCNIASLVGYSTLRRGVVGDEIRGLENDELAVLKNQLEESLKAGAFGLSSGLSYAHEIIISEIEIYELAKIVEKHNGLFSAHLRNEGPELVEAVEEVLDIARSTKVNLKISHLKARGEANWFRMAEALERIESAYHKGFNINFDLYPFQSTWQALYSYLPKWAVEGGRQAMLNNLADKTKRNKILSFLNSSQTRLPTILIASTTNKLRFSGKTLGQAAKSMETSSEEALLHILENGGPEVLVFEENLQADQVKQLLCHPLSFLATDGAGFSFEGREKLVHPRCFGSVFKFLGMAKPQGDISLSKAIKKLSSAPAKKIGLHKRGEVKIGNFADLTLFDINKIFSPADYLNPFQQGSGIECVIINGKISLKDGAMTGEMPGYVLKKGKQ